MDPTASSPRRALASLCAFAAVAAVLFSAPTVAAQDDDGTASTTTTTVPEPVYLTVTTPIEIRTNHVHRSLDDNPPAKIETYNHRTVLVGRRWGGATHYNHFRRNSNNAYRETSCRATEQEFLRGNFNCTPGHWLAGYTYRGHRTEGGYVPVFENRHDKRIVPVNHVHIRYETTTTRVCIANCQPGDTPEDPRDTPTTTTPPPVSVPPSERAVPDALLVDVKFFRHGQTGGALAAPQRVSVAAGPLTCDDGQPAPCGAEPGEGAAYGSYGPIPESLTLDEFDITAPAGFRDGRDWSTVEDAPLGANLWSPLYDPAKDAAVLQFFRATDPGQQFRIRAEASATVRYIDWHCLGGATSCPDPADRAENEVIVPLSQVQVRYLPNEGDGFGYFKVIGPTVRR